MAASVLPTSKGTRILCAAALLLSFVYVLVSFPDDVLCRVAAIGFLAAVSIPLVMMRELDVFSPLSILALSFYFYCFVGAINLLSSNQTYFFSVNIAEQLPAMYLLATIAMLGLLAGWQFGVSRGKASYNYSERTASVAGVVLNVAAVASFVLYFVLSGNFVDKSRLLPEVENRTGVASIGYLLQGFDLCVPGLVLLNSSTTKWARRTAYFFTIVLLPLALSTGFRSNVVKAIAPIVLAWYLQRQRRPSAKLCFVIALAAILIFASIGLVRSGQATFADAFTSAALFDRELLLSDLNTIQAMCMVIAKVPEQFDYLWGESIRYVPIHLLPRSLFPDKGVAPEVQLVWDATDRYAGFAIPIFGLFYLNFSYPGAFVGMALVGYFVSKVYHGFRKNPSLRRAQAYLMVIYLLAYLAFPRHSFVQTLTQVVYVFCPLLVLDLLEIAPATWCAWSNGPVYISRPARRVEVNS